MDKAEKQTKAFRGGDLTAGRKGDGDPKGGTKTKASNFSEDGAGEMPMREPPTHFSVHTKKKGVEVSVYGKAGKEHEAKKIVDTMMGKKGAKH